MKENENASKIITVMLVLILLGIIAILFYLNLFKLYDNLNSDYVAEINFAEKMWKDKTLFPDKWFYGSELMFYRHTIFIALFYGITNNYLVSLSLALFIVLILFICSFGYMLKTCNLNKNVILLTIIGVLSISGTKRSFANILYLFYGYYAIYLITIFITLGLIANKLNKRFTLKDKIIYSVLVIMAFLSGLSTIRMFQFLYLPLLISGALLIINNKNKDDISFSIKNELFVLFLFTSNILGIFIYKLKFSDSGYIHDMGSLRLTDVNEIYNSFILSVNGLFKIFGIFGNVELASSVGFDNLIKIGFVFLSLIILFKIRNMIFNNIVTLTMVISLVITIFVTTITNIAAGASQYYVLFPFICLIIVAIYISKEENKWNKYFVVAMLLVMALVNDYTYYLPLVNNKGNVEEKEVAEWLIQNDYNYAYATFWNAGLIKAGSNGRVEIPHIQYIYDNFKNNRSYLFNLLQNYEVTQRDLFQETLLIVDEKEELILSNNAESILYIYPNEKVMDIGKFNIYKFNYDIFSGSIVTFPKKNDTRITYPAFNGLTYSSSAQCTQDGAVISSGIDEDFLYGPDEILSLVEGKYKITINYEIIDYNNENSIGKVTIYQDLGNVLASKEITSNANRLNFENVEISSKTSFGLKVHSNLNAKFKIISIIVQRTY